MKVINTGRIHVKSWCEEIETSAMEQIKNLTKLPFAYHHVAIMPDCHTGYGMPIGGVIAADGVVIPNAVGVDIGCGMCALRTDIKDLPVEKLKGIIGNIRIKIPTGFSHHKDEQVWSGFDEAPDIPVIQQELKSAKRQLGTLGGGNHFIEIQKGNDGYIWIMIHSGSRNFGYQIAKEYNNKAQALCKKWYSNIPEFKGQDGLAFLPIDTTEGHEYLQSMNYALEFAYENRKQMMIKCVDSFRDSDLNIDISIWDRFINVHHNYASIENHFGKNVWVHRKGATRARSDQFGIIPGSQGSKSYIVQGKGNPESFMSCSHGAGRIMSRKKAREILDIEKEKKKLDDMGVLHAIRGKHDLDEAPSAYKNIDEVMENQKDLVEVVVELKPLAVIKG